MYNSNDGYNLYKFTFDYKQETYSGQVYSTATINEKTSDNVALDIIAPSLKMVLNTMPDRHNGVYPYNYVISKDDKIIKTIK